MTNYHIQIISDTVCPWCYIGYTRLVRAITTHLNKDSNNSNDTFSLSWKAFYLNPTAPGYPGVNKKEYYHSRFGAARTEEMWSRLVAVGEAEGITFKFQDQEARTGNTRDSHRLIWYAGVKQQQQSQSQESQQQAQGQLQQQQQQQQVEGKGKGGTGTGIGIGSGIDFGLQTRLVERLFQKYFSDEQNITDRSVLIEAGVEAGVGTREELDRFLNGTKQADIVEEGGDQVDEEALQARRKYRVSGVPFFIIQGRFGIEGADEPETFLEVFERVKRLEVQESQSPPQS